MVGMGESFIFFKKAVINYPAAIMQLHRQQRKSRYIEIKQMILEDECGFKLKE